MLETYFNLSKRKSAVKQRTNDDYQVSKIFQVALLIAVLEDKGKRRVVDTQCQ